VISEMAQEEGAGGHIMAKSIMIFLERNFGGGLVIIKNVLIDF
jgi:hypothetical protein